MHELLHPGDEPYPCGPKDLHGNELPGRDIYCDDDGFWRAFEKSDGFEIDAGPIQHRGKPLFLSNMRSESIDSWFFLPL